MKRMITLIIVLAFTYMASAIDMRFPDYRDLRPATQEELNKIKTGHASSLSAYDYVRQLNENLFAPVSDTIMIYLNRTTKFTLYGIPIGGQTYPLVGTNPVYYFVGQKFAYTIDPNYAYKMTGVLVPLGINVFGGSYRDTNQVTVMPTDVQGIPQGNAFAFGSLYLQNADSNSAEPLFTYVPFDSSGVMTEYFTVFVQTRNYSDAETDFIAIWANNQGDGALESRASLILYDQTNGWMIANFADLNIDMGGGLRPDFDILLLPVLDKELVNSVDEPVNLNGIRINSIYPNPVIGNADISMTIGQMADLRIDLLDINGRLVKNIMNSSVQPGEHTVSFTTEGLAAGTYLMAFRSGNNGVAIKTAIVK